MDGWTGKDALVDESRRNKNLHRTEEKFPLHFLFVSHGPGLVRFFGSWRKEGMEDFVMENDICFSCARDGCHPVPWFPFCFLLADAADVVDALMDMLMGNGHGDGYGD